MILEKIAKSKIYYIINIIISLCLLMSAFSYTGYKFYTLLILCLFSVSLTIFNMYKRGFLKWKKNK